MPKGEKSTWVKGMVSPNPKGRPVGSRNKITQRELTHIEELGSIVLALKALHDESDDPEFKLKILTKILEYSNNKDFITTDKQGQDVVVDRNTLLLQLQEALED
jgi:hypothetical protein